MGKDDQNSVQDNTEKFSKEDFVPFIEMEAKSNKDKLLGLIRNYYTAPKVSRGNVDLEPILKIFHSIYFHIYYLKYYFNKLHVDQISV